MSKGMGGHQSSKMISDTWLTPPEIIDELGEFDLDPCTPESMPWETAKSRYTEKDDGLVQPWKGRVWLNPPYNRETVKWLNKLWEHGDGIALIFARTETAWFFETVWNAADGILFLEGRLHFHHPDGTRAKANAGAPSCLVAYGANNANILENCDIRGRYVRL